MFAPEKFNLILFDSYNFLGNQWAHDGEELWEYTLREKPFLVRCDKKSFGVGSSPGFSGIHAGQNTPGMGNLSIIGMICGWFAGSGRRGGLLRIFVAGF